MTTITIEIGIGNEIPLRRALTEYTRIRKTSHDETIYHWATITIPDILRQIDAQLKNDTTDV